MAFSMPLNGDSDSYATGQSSGPLCCWSKLRCMSSINTD